MSTVEPRTSLFVISLPRSGSTLIYNECRRLLGLRAPRWAAAGEILNPDRLALGAIADTRQRYTTRTGSPDRFRLLQDFLDDSVITSNHAYKDVVQPFAVAAWLLRSPLRVLRIDRDITAVADAMMKRGWDYPRWGASTRLDPEAALLDGLHNAHEALASVPAASIAFNGMMRSSQALREALAMIYDTDSVDEQSLR